MNLLVEGLVPKSLPHQLRLEPFSFWGTKHFEQPEQGSTYWNLKSTDLGRDWNGTKNDLYWSKSSLSRHTLLSKRSKYKQSYVSKRPNTNISIWSLLHFETDPDGGTERRKTVPDRRSLYKKTHFVLKMDEIQNLPTWTSTTPRFVYTPSMIVIAFSAYHL